MNAAYGLIWTKVKGRDWLFIAIFALQIVPLQLAVIPLLNLFPNGLAPGLDHGDSRLRHRRARGGDLDRALLLAGSVKG